MSPVDLLGGEDDVRTAEIELFHVHLPKLSDAGYVEWDPHTNTIVPGPTFEEVASVVELLKEHDQSLPAAWP